jgi:TRAP-type transport system periplasmic protein
LSKGPDIWNSVKTGLADMGWCVHGYWPDMTPLADVINLPALPFKTSEKASEVLWKLYERFPSIQNYFKDVHLLVFYTSDPYFLITSKKQVKTVEDIKGLKIRVLGGVATEQMKALGAIPLLIPMPDNYQALDKRVIDGMAVSWEAIHSFRLYEVVKYYAMVPLSSASPLSIPINKQKWDSLPKDIQEAITSVSGLEASKFFGRNFYDTAQQGVLERVKEEKHEMVRYDPPADEIERWRKVSGEPIWKEWVQRMEKKGHSDAQQILDTTLKLLKE